MQKILVTARKAKEVTEEEIAAHLGISIQEYLALELQQKTITPAIAQKLSEYFTAPAHYFLDTSGPLDIAGRITLLKNHLEIINKPELRAMPAGATLAITTLTIELMIAKEQLSEALSRQLELMEDLDALIRINEYLNEQLAKPKTSPRK